MLLGDQYDNKAQHANNRGLSHGNIIRVTYTVSGGLARNRILYGVTAIKLEFVINLIVRNPCV